MLVNRDYKNGHTFRIGAEMEDVVPKLTLRAGVLRDISPTRPEALSPTIPDSNATAVALGLGYEISPGMAVNATYFRRWYANQTVTQNLAAPTVASYDPFCVTAPTDPLLRDASGQTTCGFMNVKPALFGLINNLVLPVSQFGKITESFNGLDFTVNARLPRGATLNGGLARM